MVKSNKIVHAKYDVDYDDVKALIYILRRKSDGCVTPIDYYILSRDDHQYICRVNAYSINNHLYHKIEESLISEILKKEFVDERTHDVEILEFIKNDKFLDLSGRMNHDDELIEFDHHDYSIHIFKMMNYWHDVVTKYPGCFGGYRTLFQ